MMLPLSSPRPTVPQRLARNSVVLGDWIVPSESPSRSFYRTNGQPCHRWTTTTTSLHQQKIKRRSHAMPCAVLVLRASNLKQRKRNMLQRLHLPLWYTNCRVVASISSYPCFSAVSTPHFTALRTTKLTRSFLVPSETFHMIERVDPDIAGWSEEGDNFVIKHVDKFASVSA